MSDEYVLYRFQAVRSLSAAVAETPFLAGKAFFGMAKSFLQARKALRRIRSILREAVAPPASVLSEHPASILGDEDLTRLIKDSVEMTVQAKTVMEKLSEKNPIAKILFKILIKRTFRTLLSDLEEAFIVIKSYQGPAGRLISAEDLLRAVEK